MTNDNNAVAEPIQDGLPAPESGRVFGLPPREQWDEWGQMRGIALTPERRSQVPQVLHSIREFSELASFRQRLLDSEARVNAEHKELAARNGARRSAYEAEVRQATLEGTEYPARPVFEEWPGMAKDYELFNRHHAILEAVERRLLHDRADDWKAYIHKLARPANVKAAKAREALAKAEEVLRPFQAAREALDRVVDQVAGNVSGMSVGAEGRIVPPTRRPGQVQAEQQVLDDFQASRMPARRRAGDRR